MNYNHKIKDNKEKDYPNLPEAVIQELGKLRKLEYAVNHSTIVTVSNIEGQIQYVNDLLCEVSHYKKRN